MTLAVLVTVPACVTRAVIVNPALPPLASDPTVQRPVAESYEPCDGAADSNASPADNTSVTWMPVAGLGPWLATITWNVSSSPTCGDERVSDFGHLEIGGLGRVERHARAVVGGIRIHFRLLRNGRGIDQGAGRRDRRHDRQRGRRGPSRSGCRRSTSGAT